MPQGPAGYARRAYATKRRAQRPAGARLLVDRTPILVSLRSVLRRALGNRGFVYSRSGVRLRAITGSTTGAFERLRVLVHNGSKDTAPAADSPI